MTIATSTPSIGAAGRPAAAAFPHRAGRGRIVCEQGADLAERVLAGFDRWDACLRDLNRAAAVPGCRALPERADPAVLLQWHQDIRLSSTTQLQENCRAHSQVNHLPGGLEQQACDRSLAESRSTGRRRMGQRVGARRDIYGCVLNRSGALPSKRLATQPVARRVFFAPVEALVASEATS
ncbi:hypothetical protein [Streptomyces sp. NPDC097610]|uniref:hypothetical protein n=1 Tax=Streptomyces sp. NPDC097610 TaxID=3157227 RepID=UPI00331A3B36